MKVAAGDILAQQDNVSSLRVGENLPPAVVGISVLKPPARVSTTPRIMDSDICFGLRIIWLSPLLSLSPVSSIFITDIPRFRYCFRRLILALC